MIATLSRGLRTLRGRLTLVYLFSSMLGFFLLAVVFLLFLSYTLRSQIDHHIHVVIAEAAQIVAEHAFARDERDRLLRNFVSARGMTVVLLSADGAPILQTNSPDVAPVSEHELQKVMALSENTNAQPVHFSINTVRFVAMPIDVGGENGVLAVGYSTDVVSQTFRSVLLVVLVVLVVLVALFSLVEHHVLKHALFPLEQIAQTAQDITDSQSLGLRIQSLHATTELSAIVGALNAMLDRLQRVFTTEHTFFSDAAHTLNTPLAVLRAQTEKLSAVRAPEKDSMLGAIDDLSHTIADLLLLSRIETHHRLKSERVSLRAVLSEVAELAQTLGEEKHLRVNTACSSDALVRCEPHLMRRALGNVVQNAVLYTGKGGCINISMKNIHNARAVVTIEDNGVGIAKRDLAHVTDRFYRGANGKTQKGSGLGLAITKAIVEHSRGTLQIDSTWGEGTRVTLTFSTRL